MELPVKLEIPKLSHLHILNVLLPFVPGIVVTLGLSLSGSPLANKMWMFGLGYKTKLTLAIAITYICGLAMMMVTQVVTGRLRKLIFRHKAIGAPWDNSYWRQVAIEYLGDSLAPANGPLTAEAIKKMTPSDLDASTARYRQTIQLLEQTKSDSAKNSTDEAVAAVTRLDEAKTSVDKAKLDLDASYAVVCSKARDWEWVSLYYALMLLPMPDDAYAESTSLAGSLQAAGIGALVADGSIC